MSNTKAIHIALSTTVTVVLLAGCNSQEAAPSNQPAGGNTSAATGQQQQSTQHNQADIAFAQGMIPHHQQAIEMANLVPDRSKNPKVVALAQQINTAQGPEISTMQQWLRQWGAKQPKPMNGGGMGSMQNGGMGGMDHGGMGHGGGMNGEGMNGDGGMGGGDQGATSMPGMMSNQQMTQLRNAQGTEFDRMWLAMMIEHHKGAVEMGKHEQRAGTNPDAKKLAGDIIDAQQREITTMNGLLK